MSELVLYGMRVLAEQLLGTVLDIEVEQPVLYPKEPARVSKALILTG